MNDQRARARKCAGRFVKKITYILVCIAVVTLIFAAIRLLGEFADVSTADAIIAVNSVVLAIATIAYLNETRAIRIAQTRPCLVVRTTRPYRDRDLCEFVIDNMGQSVALSLRIKPTQQFVQFIVDQIEDEKVREDQIKRLGAGFIQVAIPGEMYQLFDLVKMPAKDFAMHAFDLEFQDKDRRTYSEPCFINAASGNEFCMSSGGGISRIADVLEKMEQNRPAAVRVGGFI